MLLYGLSFISLSCQPLRCSIHLLALIFSFRICRKMFCARVTFVVCLIGLPAIATAYGRGAGYAWHWFEWNNDGMLSRCVSDGHQTGGCEMYGSIAYPKCAPNYHSVGCCVCEAEPYGRGVGEPSYDHCKSSIASTFGVSDCQSWGSLYYPYCKPNFNNVACCICTPGCPSGYPECS